jgi:signal transduction histidine kinase
MSRAMHQPGWMTWRICLSLILIGLSAVLRNPAVDLPLLATTVNGVLAVASGFWVCSALLLLSHSLRQQQRRASALEGSLLEISSSSRDHRERLHEVRSTVAGIRAAHDLAENGDLDDEHRARLRRTVSAELARLERLVAPPAVVVPTPRHEAGRIDLDEALATLVDTHRARGHAVEVQCNGTSVEAPGDDLTVAVNILLENAAKHAAGACSRIEVGGDESTVEILISDDGPGIAPDLGEKIFGWGVSTDAEGGHGIGLTMARRLVSEHGGSLDLVPAPTRGAAFMIRLPAARRSKENHGWAS